MWHHPKYYKELRKRNKSDQAISLRAHDGEVRACAWSGPQASSSSAKQQAASESKPEPVQVQEASSAKRQASQSE